MCGSFGQIPGEIQGTTDQCACSLCGVYQGVGMVDTCINMRLENMNFSRGINTS